MTSQAPFIIQNENLPIFRGIDGKKANAPKPAKPGRQERKALGDVSKARKIPLADAPKDVAALKGKTVIHGGGGNSKNNSVKSSHLTDEELRKCYEWAKEGIEYAHFTGNDLQKLYDDMQEERVKRKVKKVMDALHHSADVPLNEATIDADNQTKMEIVPEFLPLTTRSHSTLGDEDIKRHLYDSELDHVPFAGCKFDLKLKEDYGSDGSHF